MVVVGLTGERTRRNVQRMANILARALGELSSMTMLDDAAFADLRENISAMLCLCEALCVEAQGMVQDPALPRILDASLRSDMQVITALAKGLQARLDGARGRAQPDAACA